MIVKELIDALMEFPEDKLVLTESNYLKEKIRISPDQVKELEHSYGQYKNVETIDIDKPTE